MTFSLGRGDMNSARARLSTVGVVFGWPAQPGDPDLQSLQVSLDPFDPLLVAPRLLQEFLDLRVQARGRIGQLLVRFGPALESATALQVDGFKLQNAHIV